MKDISDIKAPGTNTDTIIISSESVSESEVLDTDSSESFTDLSSGDYSNTIVLPDIQKDIVVDTISSKKSSDSLIRKKYRFFSLKKTISLVKKKTILENISLSLAYREVKRFFIHRGPVHITILFSLCIVGLLLFGLILSVATQNRVYAGYEKILMLRESGQTEQIHRNINNARFDFLLSNILFTPIKIVATDQTDSIEKVIQGGKSLSSSLDQILTLYFGVESYVKERSLGSIYFSNVLESIRPEIEDIHTSMTEALETYKSISWLPDENSWNLLNNSLEDLEKGYIYVDSVVTHFEGLLELLGHNERKRYMIVFQNADEIRPTGGFMGSMGLLEVFKGRVQLFQKKDVYAIEWDLKSAEYDRLTPPLGIDRLTDSFGLRDANYFINLEESSKNINFFTKNAGLDLDGVIYINQSTLIKMLEVTGPVYLPELDREITSENFSELMSLVVEAKTFQEGTLGTPKQILFDFIQEYSGKLLEDKEYLEYIKVLTHDIESRDIMMWSFDPVANDFLQSINMTGEVSYANSLDFSYPVYTSISGNKSDRYMQRSYTQQVIRQEDCSYDVEFEIVSRHTFNTRTNARIQGLIDEFELETENLLQIQGAGTNRQFVRVLLPSGAEIENKEDMEIVDYGSRRGVQFFLETEPTGTSSYAINYRLENSACEDYDYIFYKQPGIEEYNIDFIYNNDSFSYNDIEEDFYFEIFE